MNDLISFKFKVGQQVKHVDYDQLVGFVVQVGFFGQIENMTKDFNLHPTIEQINDTFVDSVEEYFQPCYRILWSENDTLMVTDSLVEYNGQEHEGQLELV